MSKVTIYSKTTCPYCVRAKEILTQKGVAYTEELVSTREQLQEAIGKPVTSVPQIVIDGKHIGGCQELAELYGVPLWENK